MNNNYHTQIENKNILNTVGINNNLIKEEEVNLSDIEPVIQQQNTQPVVQANNENKPINTDNVCKLILPTKSNPHKSPYYVISIVIAVLVFVLFYPPISNRILNRFPGLDSSQGVIIRAFLIALIYLFIQKMYNFLFEKKN